MKKILLISILIHFFSSCNEKTETTIESTNETKHKKQTLEEIVHRHVQAQLSMPATEKYTLNIYKEHLDGDNKLDAIITVNRLEFAINESKKSGKYEKHSELGFTGHYNYIFYYDGQLNQISPSILVPSSPAAKLKINFTNLISDVSKDIAVDYKIRNSSFRNYYTVINHTPRLVFQWKLYDFLGEKKEEANFIELESGTIGLSKDIVIYKGKMINSNNVKDIYQFEPQIIKNGELLYRFFYLEKEGKYFTKK
jgi:hypothetical protein